MAEPSINAPEGPRQILRRELELRCQKNPAYSLRAFAKALQMSPTALSFVSRGHRPLSLRTAQRVMELLPLGPTEYNVFLKFISNNDLKNNRSPKKVANHQFSLDSFAFISDWYHYAILSLLEIPGAKFEPLWISRHLGIQLIEAENAMERLKHLGLVKQIRGQWKQATGPIRIGNDVPTAATKSFQKQLLLKAINSLENDPVETRDFSSMTLVMSSDLIPYAKKRIRDFRRRLAEELEAKGSKEQVYKFTIQIFPVSKSVNKRE